MPNSTKEDSKKDYENHAESVVQSLAKVDETVKGLIETYIKTFRVNFSFQCPGGILSVESELRVRLWA